MESYTDFALVYDEFMDETPYEKWCDRIKKAIEKYGITKPDRSAVEALESERNLVVDLGCGTGTLTQLLYDAGYDMIGIDYSESMLERAIEKRDEAGAEILYLNQDMRELELFSTVGTVISVCDSINYLLENEDLQTTVELVHNYLYPGGLFIFDFNTDYKYREVIGDTTIAENRDECSFIWDNFYDPEERINEYDLTIFLKEDGDMYRKFTETHFQKGYEPDVMKDILVQAGFEIIEMSDSDAQDEDKKEVSKETERVFVIAKCIKG